MLKLMYITNSPDIARVAQSAGVDRIFVDMEYIGKADRQGGMNTVQNRHTAEDALASLHKGTIPDLFVLDLNLPGMSGFDFLETIRKEFKPTIPVVIVSARDADEDIIKGLGFGADEFVTKPFSPRVLVARIQAKLERQAVTSAAAEESAVAKPATL